MFPLRQRANWKKATRFNECKHRSKTYISPSDNIMSPCTAKLSALRNKQVGKYVSLHRNQPLKI